MKTTLIFFVTIFFSFACFAQDYTEIKSSQLPKKATEWIKKNLPKATISRLAKINDKPNIRYGVFVTERDSKMILVFDKDGNYLDRAKNLEELTGKKYVKKDPKATPVVKPANDPNTDPPQK